MVGIYFLLSIVPKIPYSKQEIFWKLVHPCHSYGQNLKNYMTREIIWFDRLYILNDYIFWAIIYFERLYILQRQLYILNNNIFLSIIYFDRLYILIDYIFWTIIYFDRLYIFIDYISWTIIYFGDYIIIELYRLNVYI